MPDKLESMGEPEEDGPREDASASQATSTAASEAKRQNDATMALSESEFIALQVPSAPPAIPAGKPARASSPVSRNDASMWAGSVVVADEFEPLVVPRKPLGRWVFLALFGLGVVGAALYFLWWQPAQEVAAAEPLEEASAAAKAAEPDQPAPTAAPAPAPAPEPAPAAQPPPAQPASVAAPEKPAATPTPKKTASKKKSSKKKSSSKKKTSSKKKKKKKRSTRRGG